MKIAILTSGILPVPAVQGGAVENLIDFYLEYNDKHRLHDITVYSVWHPEVERHTAQKSDVNHYYYINASSMTSRLHRKLYQFFHAHEYYNYFIEYFFEQAYSHIAKEHYDCILMENRPGYVYKLSQRGFSNLILHLHNDLLNHDTPYAHEIFKNLKKILTVSDYIKNRVSTIPLSHAGDRAKIVTVHNGINLQQFRENITPPITRGSLGFGEKDFILVYSGRLNKEKGISELIGSMLLLKDLPMIKLMIIGSTFFGNATNEDSFVRTLKEKVLPIKERVLFTGFIPYKIIPGYLQLADVAIIPSVWDDPFPTTVLEAQAAGLPIITTNRGGIPEEVTREDAIIVPTERQFIEGLNAAIRQLYHNPQKRAEMAKAARQHAEKYDKEHFARNFFYAIENNKL